MVPLKESCWVGLTGLRRVDVWQVQIRAEMIIGTIWLCLQLFGGCLVWSVNSHDDRFRLVCMRYV